MKFNSFHFHCLIINTTSLSTQYQILSEVASDFYSLAFPCMDPAIAPGTSLLERELAMRPVPAGLAGWDALHALEWCLNALGTKRRWQCGHCSKLCSKAANALYRDAKWPLYLACYSNGLQPKKFLSRIPCWECIVFMIVFVQRMSVRLFK